MIENPGKTLGIRPKSDLNQTIDIPGPGQYSPVKADKSFAFSMGSRYKQLEMKMKAGMPGPG